MLPMISNVSAARVSIRFSPGIEYYNSQLYQPGDEIEKIWIGNILQNITK